MENIYIEMLKLAMMKKKGTFVIGTELNDTIIKQILEANINSIEISITNSINKGPYLLTTLLNDKNNSIKMMRLQKFTKF